MLIAAFLSASVPFSVFWYSSRKLENGGRYYFTIENVTDMSNSFNEVSPNPVDFFRNQATSAANGHNVPVFVVEFARVSLNVKVSG